MKSENFELTKHAKAAALKQLEFYNIIMDSKMKQEQNKIAEKKLFVVDTIVTFRHRYVIKATELEHAYDEVIMIDSGNDDDSFGEVSQRCLGEVIVDGREISKKDFKKMLKDLEKDKGENSSCWMGDKLIRVVDYDR